MSQAKKSRGKTKNDPFTPLEEIDTAEEVYEEILKREAGFVESRGRTYPDFHEITMGDLKKAYREGAKELHPDQGGSQQAFEELERIHEEYLEDVKERNQKREEQKKEEDLENIEENNTEPEIQETGKGILKRSVERLKSYTNNVRGSLTSNLSKNMVYNFFNGKEQREMEEECTDLVPFEGSIFEELEPDREEKEETTPFEDWDFKQPKSPEIHKLSQIKGIDQEYAEEVAEYQGNTEMARKVLETEWKIENIEEYIEWDQFSKGSLTGEAEYLIAELGEKERRELIKDMSQADEISTTWQDRHGNLMGYDKEKQRATKLVDSYDQLEQKIDRKYSKENSLRHMINETKQQIDDYQKAALKSITNAKNKTIEDEKLVEYVEDKLDNR